MSDGAAGREPPSPYREGKPLDTLIPPDRRRARAAALLLIGAFSGVVLDRLAEAAYVAFTQSRASPVVDGRAVVRATLRGPDGEQALPNGRKTVVHVWLQGCADCMPAFEAMRRDSAEFEREWEGVPTINVAYGQADPSWAAAHGVRHHLVYDATGSAIVQPLGITSFTTLVLDEGGHVLHRDRPDSPGYVGRIRHALALSAR